MKTTTYKIGQNGHGAPNEKISSMETFNTDFINKLNSEEEILKFDKNSRRCDPDNPNRVLTIGFGFGWEKGSLED